jgi:hypothetical protein
LFAEALGIKINFVNEDLQMDQQELDTIFVVRIEMPLWNIAGHGGGRLKLSRATPDIKFAVGSTPSPTKQTRLPAEIQSHYEALQVLLKDTYRFDDELIDLLKRNERSKIELVFNTGPSVSREKVRAIRTDLEMELLARGVQQHQIVFKETWGTVFTL